MSGWIKLEKDLLTDPRLLRRALWVSQSLEMKLADGCAEGWDGCNGRPLPGVTLVLGALAQLWMIADSHIGEDDILPLGVDEIDEVIGIPGFCQMLPSDWLQVLDEDRVKLPGYHQHNGTIAKERALNQRRVAQSRDKKKRSTVTNCNANALPDQDLDQDLDLKKKTPTVSRARKVPREPALGDAHLPLHDSLPLDAWAEWLDHRRAKRWPCDLRTLRIQLKTLASLGTEDQRHTILTAIQAGWQGLFPRTTTNGKHAPDAPSRYDRNREELARRGGMTLEELDDDRDF